MDGNSSTEQLDILCLSDDASTPQSVAYVIVSALVLLINAFTISIIARSRKMRTHQGYIMMSLAVCDFLLGVIFIVPVIGLHSSPVNCLTPALCKFVGYTGSCLASVSIYTHLVLTLDKYCSIVQPLSYQEYDVNALLVASIAVTWAAPLCVWLLPLMNIGGEFTFHEHQFACYFNFTKFQWISIGYIFVVFGVSCIGMGVLYFRLWKLSRWHLEIISRTAGRNPQHGDCPPSSGKKHLRTPLLIVFCFYASWCPLFITCVIKIFSEVTVTHWCDAIIFIFAMCNSMWNPLVYFFTFRPFQQEVKRIFHCRETRLRPLEVLNLERRHISNTTLE